MIRELDRREIEKTLDQIIKNYSHDENYKHWFNGVTEIPLPVRAFLVGDGSYYVDIDECRGVKLFGILKLKETNKPILSDVVELMNRCIDEYKVLACFRDKRNKRVTALWKYLEKKCDVTTEEIQVDNIIVKLFYKE